jgi:hypothetical protein
MFPFPLFWAGHHGVRAKRLKTSQDSTVCYAILVLLAGYNNIVRRNGGMHRRDPRTCDSFMGLPPRCTTRGTVPCGADPGHVLDQERTVAKNQR